MGQSDEGDEKTEREFDELCLELNMDQNSKEEAWDTFCRISTNYTLEGESLHWLACALYVSCRGSVVPTVGRGVMEGNCVSLTRLLRSSKLSLLQFFSKMKKWSDMANLSQTFREKVDRLERNFAVSTVIFKKFEPIYLEIFKDPAQDAPRQPKSRKHRRLPCSSTEIFSLCWTMFVQVKGNFPAISDDLVNSYHLLLCCLDFFFSNVLLSNRKDLLNPDFSGLPENWENKEYNKCSEVPCIIDLLCKKYEGLVLEAKGIKEHWWKPHVKKLFDRKVIKGRTDQLAGVIDTGNFESNSKAINCAYEEYVLSVGDFDERIFLGKQADTEIGTPAKLSDSLSEKMQEKKNLRQHFDTTTTLAPSTPLTGRKYLKDRDHNVTPVSTATQGVSRLQTLLSGRKTGPSEKLNEIFSSCKENPKDAIMKRVKKMGEIFCTYYAKPSEDHHGSHMDFAKRRLQLAESLYFKALEDIMVSERSRLSGRDSKVDLTTLLDQDVFHKSLLACCLEVVIYSYNSQRMFPWIVEIFDLSPYHFYKVIEILIRTEDGLSRDVVKHLNHIEESILEELAWKGDSPLWAAIKEGTGEVPRCDEVALPSQLEGAQTGQPQSFTSPIMHPAVRRLAGSALTQPRDPNQSPTGPPSISERFGSPAAGSAKRRLFNAGQQGAGSAVAMDTTEETPASKPRTVVQLHMAQTEDGRQVLIPIQVIPSKMNTAATSSPQKTEDALAGPPNKAKKSGSLALFFRKIYHMASIRLHDLCKRLDINDELRRKIWTCFEYSITNHSDLMMDRHLDQLLMCAVYVISKVTQSVQSFQDIMKEYRLQPQAQSHVYRSVLLRSRRRRSSGESNSSNGASGSGSPSPVTVEDKSKETKRSERLANVRSTSTLPIPQPNSQPPTPTKITGTASVFEFEERGDLIKFYNQVYVKKMKNFALKFSAQKEEGCPPLSPLPVARPHPASPRRVSHNHSLYISPHKSCGPPMTPNSRLLYCFNRSPAKDLRAINTMLRMGERKLAGKRILQGDDSSGENPAKRIRTPDNFSRRLQEVQSDRESNTSRNSNQ